MAAVCGLLIDVHFSTGKRAAGIDPRDPNFVIGEGWQNLQGGKEIRLLKDGDATPYRGLEGVKILAGAVAVDAAIESLHESTREDDPSRFVIVNERLADHFIRQAKVDVRDLDPTKPDTWAKALYEKGCVGIAKMGKPKQSTCNEIAEAHGIIGERFKAKVKGR